MLKKTIQYKNVDGELISEDFYFNLSMAELLADAVDEEYLEMLKMVSVSNDNRKIVEIFTDFMRRSVGQKTANGKRLDKDAEIVDDFMFSDAYSVLLLEMMSNAGYAAEFINQVFPEEMLKRAQELNTAKQVGSEVQLPSEDTRPAWIREEREPTAKELMAMSREEMQAAFARKLSSNPK
jgi:hypothetical protein